jgi:hypothetical protein
MADTIAIRVALNEVNRVVSDFKAIGDAGDREMKRLGQSAEQGAQRMGSLRGAISGIGLQLQDVAVQLQSGTSVFTVIAQQAPQALSAFGGLGIAIGTVTSLVAVAAGAFFGLGKSTDAAAEAAKSFKATQEGLDGLLGRNVDNVDKLRQAYDKLSGAQRDSANVALQRQAQDKFTEIRAEQDKVRASFQALGGASRLGDIDSRLSTLGVFSGAVSAETKAAMDREIEKLRQERDGLLAADRLLQDMLTERKGSTAQSDFLGKATTDRLKAFGAQANDASLRIAELNKQLEEVQERSKELFRRGSGNVEILGGSPEADKRIKDEERERIASLKRVETEQKRIERELAAERKKAQEIEIRRQADLFAIDPDRASLQRFGQDVQSGRLQQQLEEGQRREAERRKTELQREADRQADILVRPFQDAAQAATGAFTQAFEQILTEGRVSADELAKSFGDSITKTLAQLPALLAQIPISAGIKSVTDSIAAEIAGGGSGFGAFLSSPFGAGALGMSAGMLGSSLLGGNSTGSSIGSLGGAVLGGILGSIIPGVGTAIGAGLGGLGGGLLGGLFGGGGGNNGAGSALRLGTGLLLPGSDAKSGENQQQANAILQSLQQTQQLLLRAGVSFDDTRLKVRIGDKSGFQLFANDNERSFGSANQLQAGAFQELLRSGSGYSATLDTVIANVKGKRAEVVQDALAFAAAFDRMASPAGALIEQLRELNIQFDQASSRAQSYGLDVAEIEKARAKATTELLEGAEGALTSRVQQIKGAFEALLDPIRQTLTGINIGGLSALSPSAQLELARGEFQSLAGRALSGDERSIQQLSGAGQTFLQQARQFGASGETFQSAFREVNAVLSQVLASGEARQESILSSLPDAIRNANADTIATLQKGFGEMVDQVALLRAEIARVRPLAA